MPKMHQTTFGGRAPPGSTRWRSLSTRPDTLAAVKGVLLLRGERGGKGRRKGWRGRARRGKEGDGREGSDVPPPYR